MSAINLSNISPSNTASASLTSLQAYFKARQPDVQQLKDAVLSGDLAAAKQAYNNLVSLSKTQLDRNNPFFRSDRAADFSAIGSALASGNLAGAVQAFVSLHDTFGHPPVAVTPKEVRVSQAAAVVNLSGTGNSAADVGSTSGNLQDVSRGVNVVA